MKTVSEKKKIAEKLHKQFRHASSNKISKLVKSAGIKDSELFNLINEVEVNCPVCLKYKKAPPKPVVGFSLSKDFNDVIAIDLKEINGHNKILHIIKDDTVNFPQIRKMIWSRVKQPPQSVSVTRRPLSGGGSWGAL